MQARRMRRLVLLMGLASVAAAGCGGTQQAATEPASPAAGAPAADQGQAAPSATPAEPAEAGAPDADQSGAATGEAVSAADKAMAERAVAMMEDMGRIAEATPDDCDKLADQYQAVLDRDRNVIAAGKAFNQDPAKKKWFEETYGQRMLAAASKMMPALQKCQKNEKLKKVFQSLDG